MEYADVMCPIYVPRTKNAYTLKTQTHSELHAYIPVIKHVWSVSNAESQALYC